MKKKARYEKRKLFNPDTITTSIAQAITRDLSPDKLHEYCLAHDSKSLLAERWTEDLLKKYVSKSGNTDELELLTYEKFRKVNRHMESFRGQFIAFPTDKIRPQTRYKKMDRILLRARALMHSVLTPFLEDEWFQYCKHGTGSSIGVHYNDTSLEAKSTFPITLTKRVEPIMTRYLEFDSQLNSALLYHNEHVPTGTRYNVVKGSRATTVEKNDQIRRMIAVEPTGNMFFQQGLMAMMYQRMRKFKLDVELLPDMHKNRAMISSITSHEATIDWSSASDCVSIDLLRWLLPPLWFDWCEAVRSPSITIGDQEVELNMFSTMGNAVTFPLETLVFWTMGHALILDDRSLSCFPEWEDLLECSVFGDDCIVPTRYAKSYISLMTQFGFIVNEEKSFYDDKGFRESCGGDFFHGYDVRPVNIKAPTSCNLSALEPWLYIIANSVIPKYISLFGTRDYIYKCDFFKLLFCLFDKYDIAVKLVPYRFPDDAGLKIAFDLQRFARLYPCKYSKVTVSRHGSYEFLYLRFNYRKNLKRSEDLHYSSWLKTPGGHRAPWYASRRKGGYIVAKGKSCHWHVPSLFS